MWWIILFIHAIVCAFLSANIAEKKGYNSTNWGLCGFFFGFLGLIAAAGLPRKQKNVFTEYKSQKKCPDCTEFINSEAYVCKYCGHKFDKNDIILKTAPATGKSDIELQIESHKLRKDLSDLIKAFEQESIPNRISIIDTMRALRDKTITLYLINELEKPRYNLPDYSKLLDKITETILETIDSSAIPNLISSIEKGGYGKKTTKLIEILGSLGTPAIPHLKKIIEEDESLKEVAKKTLKSVETKL